MTWLFSLLPALPLAYLLSTVRPSIWQLPSSRNIQLSFPSYRMIWPERIMLFAFIAFKAIWLPKLESTGSGFTLPVITLTCPVTIDERDRALYAKASMSALSASASSDAKSTQTPFILAAMTNSMMVMLLAHPSCPVNPLGAVNVRNRFEFYSSHATGAMKATATFGSSPGRRTRRGIEFDVVIEVKEAEKVILRQVVTVMKPLPKHTKPAPAVDEPTKGETNKEQERTVVFDGVSFPTSAPDLWAALCSDYNPIHMSAVAARLFGFPGRILHGNNVVAAFLEATSTNAELAKVFQAEKWQLEVQFKRPMVLPLRNKRFEVANRSEKHFDWSLCDDKKEYVVGTVST